MAETPDNPLDWSEPGAPRSRRFGDVYYSLEDGLAESRAVFLAYGLVGPLATRLKEIIDGDAAYYKIIQSVLVAHLHGNAAQISVEIGRGDVPSTAQPSFAELEEALADVGAAV